MVTNRFNLRWVKAVTAGVTCTNPLEWIQTEVIKSFYFECNISPTGLLTQGLVQVQTYHP